MPQLILPIIPEGATQINELVSVFRGRKRWTYYLGICPIYSHDESDRRMFNVITAQMVVSGR
jgi:hypothetical protein